jgi:hypothetical protein
LQHVKIKDPELLQTLYHVALQNNGKALQFIDKEHQTQELCLMAIKNKIYAFEYIKIDLTDNIIKCALLKNGLLLEFVPNQTNEFCKIAIIQNSYAIKFVKNQTEDLCKLALKNNIESLKYIKEELHTKEFHDYIFSISKNTDIFKLFINPCEEICLKAVILDMENLKYIKDKKLFIKCAKDIKLARRFKCINICSVCLQFNKYYLANLDDFVYICLDCACADNKYNIDYTSLYVNSAFYNIIKMKMEACIICNDIKKKYKCFTCDEKHVVCADCAEKMDQCYYRCQNSEINQEIYIINE